MLEVVADGEVLYEAVAVAVDLLRVLADIDAAGHRVLAGLLGEQRVASTEPEALVAFLLGLRWWRDTARQERFIIV